ncbi:MAG TPA: HAD-IIIC family phosphatase [Opitutaceae bacterium]|jgi:FkbH-like protein
MNLAEAMSLANTGAASAGAEFRVFLSCSFTPLHLRTLLAAHLVERLPGRRVTVGAGPYGDLLASLRQVDGAAFEAAAVAIEWEDLDPRLGLRSSQPGSASLPADVLQSAASRLQALAGALRALAEKVTVAVSLPTLPLAPMTAEPLAEAAPAALELKAKAAEFGALLAALKSIRLVSPEALGRLSPAHSRHDAQGHLRWDFPYHQAHASALAQLLSRAIAPAPAKKAIITDLDGTLWHGVLGDDGVEGISWDLGSGSHHHAIYQRMLCALADAGVLVGVASKNDPKLAQEALARKDLVVGRKMIFPVEANWGPKSASVGSLLKAWNIGADGAVFVDDSEFELAEVKGAFPGVTCLPFPKDAGGLGPFVDRLKELFGRRNVTSDDRLRLGSLRQNWERNTSAAGTSEDDFLSGAEATVTAVFNKPDARMFELVNKTNQFNLNGRRLDEAAWRRQPSEAGSFVLGIAYQDKFGPLGTVAVVAGRKEGARARVLTWVMSCRAFSRRIEHQTLRILFDSLGVAAVDLDYAATERNGPFHGFLRSIGAPDAGSPVPIGREEFLSKCPRLFAKTLAG